MRSSFVSESITPVKGSFDVEMMARGEPGLPHQFRWRKKEWRVAAILESWKEHGDCAHGSGERYVRKHGYRIRTTEGLVLKLYFQRSFGGAKFRISSRWWIYSMEEDTSAPIEGCGKISPRAIDRASADRLRGTGNS